MKFKEKFFFKRYDENGEVQVRRRSPILTVNNGIDSSTDVSFAASSSILHQQQRFRSNTQMTDRSSTSQRQRHHHQQKIVRAQSRTHSSSSDERLQPSATSPINSIDTSDDDDPNSILSHHSRLRRKYVKSRQRTSPPPPPPPLSRQQSLRDQPSPSPTLRYASNGVLLRSKHHHQQQHSNNVFQSSSKDMGKKLKRFTLDTVDNRWHHQYQTVPNNQQTPDLNIYRSSLAIVPSLNANVYGVQINHNLPSSLKQQSQQKDEFSNDLQQRPKVII